MKIVIQLSITIVINQFSGVFLEELNNNPPHCTNVTKSTDYITKYKFNYPVAYIQPGQHEAYQQLYCLNPPAVSHAEATVCDWAAPPDVQFTVGDTFLHVVRQDPANRYLGNAVIRTTQMCSHTIPPHLKEKHDSVSITQVSD